MPMLEAHLSLPRLQLSPAARWWSLEPAPRAKSRAGIQVECVPSVGSEGLALQPVGVAQEVVHLASRLN